VTGVTTATKAEYGLKGLLACVHSFLAKPLRLPGGAVQVDTDAPPIPST